MGFYGRRMVPEYLIKKLEKGPVKLKDITNITTLTDDEINTLEAGDIVLKKTSNQYHAYIVSYKEDNQGICLTYTDASCIETVSYDYTGGHWIYNSTDITSMSVLEAKQDKLTAGTGININSNNLISCTVSPVHVTKVIIHAFDGTKDYYVTGVVYTSTVLNEPDVDDMLRLFQSQKTGLFVQDGQTEVYNGLYLNDYGDNYMEFSTYGDEAYVNITPEEDEFDYSVDRYYHII